MAIFEFDDGHGTLVQPMLPSVDSFDSDAAALVAENAGELIGEPVLTVREIGAGDGSQLLALDAAARPVVVEAVQLLDATSLLRALRHAGGTARMSRADIARLYRGGPEAFESDLAVFRDRAPLVRSERSSHSGVRLVLVCGDIAEGLQEAVDFLVAGTQVDILRLGVTEGPGGRRYLDVSPMRPGAGRDRRPVEPGPATGTIPVVHTAPTPVVAGAAAGEPVAAADSGDLLRPVSGAAHRPRHGGEDVRTPARGVDTRDVRGVEATTVLPAVGAEQLQSPVVSDPLPELAALAASEHTPLELIWVRVRRNQRLTATLRVDGLIELADGRLYADPGQAAIAAADLERPADGWRVWHIGTDGRSLGEVVGVR